jgi:hypothetical protein
MKGNGVFMSPDGTTAFVTTIGATIYAISPYSGATKWTYQVQSTGENIARSHSAVTFSPTGSFMAMSVVDNENSATPTT